MVNVLEAQHLTVGVSVSPSEGYVNETTFRFTVDWALNGSMVYADVEIDYGDGSRDYTSGYPPVEFYHTYSSAGKFTVKVTVTDEYGNTGSNTVEVSVSEYGKPKGKIEDYDFPSQTTAGKTESFYVKVHNVGGASGVIGAGIGNLSGNPGSITIGEQDVQPGYVLIFYGTKDVCEILPVSGNVRFNVKGKYTIRILGLHKEGEDWIIDDYVDVNG